ncbi:TolC family protein [Neolewinella antarctica]|uniref:TolC family protein n=1 Tax=Neolewinella antarctica TaxID=442734 RepID=A0ABX0XHP0_9BACT|nr:hypothetical protein [Neolewinella antarctica]NJC28371.1 hypothetical protein [Neolewinella antarctica]
MNVRPLFFLVLLLLAGSTADGQRTITADRFFAIPAGQTLIPLANPATSVASGPTPIAIGASSTGVPRMPWIERYVFRTETRDFDPGSQEFTMRLLPSTPGKRRAQQNLGRARESMPDFNAAERACEVIEQRYEDWLDLFALTQEKALLEQLLAVLQDRETILGKMAGSLDFDWSELIRLRTTRTDLTIRLGEMNAEENSLLTAYGLGGDSLLFADFPTPRQLSLDVADSSVGGSTTKSRENDYDLSLIETELALERAEQKQYFDFLQFKYRGPNDDFFRERFSVGLGFRIPNDGNDRLKVRELEIEREQLEIEQATILTETTTMREEVSTRLRADVAAYAEREDLYAEELAYFNELTAQIARATATDPDLLLNVRERQVRNELRLLDRRLRLTDDYLKGLREASALCAEPGGTYLRR